MQPIRIAAAQSVSVPGDIAANVLIHTRFIAAASQEGVNLLVFPELSLSGYELSLLRACVVQPADDRLAPIRDLARETHMTVVVGAPVGGNTEAAPSIGAITFFPEGGTAIYRKQHLHAGEENYVTKGKAGATSHALFGESFALAICADTAHEHHAASAAASGASLYLAGVLVSDAGYAADSANLQRYAANFDVAVLMSNHGGPSGGYVSARGSAFWAPGGKLVVTAPGTGVVSNDSEEWRGELHVVGT
jgi:predicted amidohydrolase